jgi:hypothetical protein
MSVSADQREREARAVKRQSVFREINERMKKLNEMSGVELPADECVCECADKTCVARVEIAAEEYEAIRLDGARFLVFPSDEHVWFDVEHVAHASDRYWVVEKTGDAAELAKGFDPRQSVARLRIRT